LKVLVGVCLLGAVSGCGTSEYEALVAARFKDVQLQGPFRKLFAPAAIPGTPFKIRVPMVFNSSYLANSPHTDDGEKINPQRVQPPFLELPGFRLCYEGVAASVSSSPPFYCYLAAFPCKPGDGEKWEADLQAKLKALFPNTPDTWETVQALTPKGDSLTWKKIRVINEQDWLTNDAEGKVKPTRMNGTFELWLYEGNDHIVLMAWRVPASLDAPPAGGGADDRPDMAIMPGRTAGTLVFEPEAEQPAAAPGA